VAKKGRKYIKKSNVEDAYFSRRWLEWNVAVNVVEAEWHSIFWYRHEMDDDDDRVDRVDRACVSSLLVSFPDYN
jgi:hypothetical protein